MIDKTFRNRIINTHGKQGEAWLSNLTSTLSKIQKIWGVEIEKIHEDLSYNLIAVTRQNTILKIGPNIDEIDNEAKCLKLYNGAPSCLLLEYNLDFGALHLEKLGENLYSQKHITDNEQTEICATVIKNIPKRFNDLSSFKKIDSWLLALEPKARKNHPNKKVLDKAFSISKDLIQSSENYSLLHGDLHHKNILKDSKNNWKAIDPKGVVGDPVYEVGAFIRNPIPDIFKNSHLISNIENRIDIFNDTLGYDKQKIAAWSFVQSVLSWLWFIDAKDDNAIGIERVIEALNQIYK